MFGKKRRQEKTRKQSEIVNLYLVAAMPAVLAKVQVPAARVGAQVFILGMVDMLRQVEGLSMEEFAAVYELVLDTHLLAPERPVPELIDAIGRAASNDGRIGQLVMDGAQSLRAFVAHRDHEAPIDLLRAVVIAESNAELFSDVL